MLRRKKPRYGTLAYYLQGLAAEDVGKRIVSSRYIRSGSLYGADNAPLRAAMPQLIAALSDDVFEVRLNIAYAIGYATTGEPKEPSAFRALFVYSTERMPSGNPDSSVGDRSRAAEEKRLREEFLKARVPGAAALPRLLELTAAASEPVRVEAVATLGMMGKEARSAIPSLRPLIRSELPSLQVAALVAIDLILEGDYTGIDLSDERIAYH